MSYVSRQEFSRVKEQVWKLDGNQKAMQQQLDHHTVLLKDLTAAIERMATSDLVARSQDQMHRHLEAMEKRMTEQAKQRDEELKQLAHWKRDQQAVGRAGSWLLKMLPSLIALASIVIAGISLLGNK